MAYKRLLSHSLGGSGIQGGQLGPLALSCTGCSHDVGQAPTPLEAERWGVGGVGFLAQSRRRWQDSVPCGVGLRPEFLRSRWLVRGRPWFLARQVCSWSISQQGSLLRQSEGEGERERAKMKGTISVTSSEVSPHDRGYIIFLRSESLDPAHTQEWGFVQSCDFQKSWLPSSFSQSSQSSMTAGASSAFFPSSCQRLKRRCSMDIFNRMNKRNSKPHELPVLHCRKHAC